MGTEKATAKQHNGKAHLRHLPSKPSDKAPDTAVGGVRCSALLGCWLLCYRSDIVSAR